MDSSVSLCNSVLRRHKKGVDRLGQHLEKWKDIGLSNSPSKVLAIGNAGFACGFSLEDVELVVRKSLLTSEILLVDSSDYGGGGTDEEPISSVSMVPDKSFAFVGFRDEKDAQLCLERLKGRSFKSSSGQVLPWFPVFVKETFNEATHCHTQHFPPGLTYIADFITGSLEKELLDFVDDELSKEISPENMLKNRTVLHYGYQFRYRTNDVDTTTPAPKKIPSVCESLLKKLVDLNCVPSVPDQLTINVYEPGQGIPPHIDTHSAFEDGIASLSLGSSVIMDFSQDSLTLPVVLHPRSVVSMQGESRYAWKHGIALRHTDCISAGIQSWRRKRRVSFTFRCLRKTPCVCKYAKHCDSQSPHWTDVSETESPVKNGSWSSVDVEQSHVYDVYENIAAHFSDTRYKPWPKVVQFLESLPSGSVLVDIGCGNGKYLAVQNQLVKVGCDRSANLLEICRNQNFEVLLCDILDLPFRSGSCDAVICIAVVHHLSSEQRRIKAIEEIARVLAVGGQALISVWAMEQKKGGKVSTYLKSDRNGDGVNADSKQVSGCTTKNAVQIPIHDNRTQFKHQDLLVPWHLKPRAAVGDNDSVKHVLHRFYHVFREGELRQCCHTLLDIVILEEYYDEGNWFIILRKVVT